MAIANLLLSLVCKNISMSVLHETFTYEDAYGVCIHAQKWIPDPRSLELTSPVAGDNASFADANALGVVQILHGISEHLGRYDRFARDLAAAGFLVYGEDHRGHGRTGLEQHNNDTKKLGKLGKGGLRATEDAICQLTAIIREAHPELKIAAFAHSWGSLMAQRIIGRTPEMWDAVILSGSAYRTPRHMNTGDLNKGFGPPGGREWLSRDPQVALDFNADPLAGSVEVMKHFGPANAAKLFGVPKAPLSPQVPILIASGSADSLNKHNGLTLLANDLRRAGARDVRLKIYPDARHELIHEINRDEVIADILTWLTDRIVEGDAL